MARKVYSSEDVTIGNTLVANAQTMGFFSSELKIISSVSGKAIMQQSAIDL